MTKRGAKKAALMVRISETELLMAHRLARWEKRSLSVIVREFLKERTRVRLADVKAGTVPQGLYIDPESDALEHDENDPGPEPTRT